MGQKVNPIIFRSGETETWKSKYFEKKKIETSMYAKKDIEIRNFILKYFEDYDIKVHDCRLNYLDSSLRIFISYFIPNVDSLKAVQKVKIEKLINSKKINKLLNNRSLNCFKKEIKNTKMLQITSFFETEKDLKINNVLNNLRQVLKMFFDNKINVYFVLQKMNNNFNKTISDKNKNNLKKELSSLRKYSKNSFFQKGVNILFVCCLNNNSSKLLAKYIAAELATLKRHNLFLKFLKSTILIFNKNSLSKIKGVKVKIKGRLNGRPRAKHQVVEISQGVPILSINSKVNYSEETCFTSNGTLGIKVWVHEN